MFPSTSTILILYVALLTCIQPSHGRDSMPEECKDGSYMNLIGEDHQHRYINYEVDDSFKQFESHDKTKEFDFEWFRFNLKKATQMLELNDVSDLIMKNKEKVKPCGTNIYPVLKTYQNPPLGFGYATVSISSLFFVLNDFHPMKKYGLIYTSSIGCQYSYHSTGSPQYACDLSGFMCNLTLTCHPQSATPLIVRNCGDFYVYKSQPLPPYNGLSLQSAFGGRSVTPKDGLFCGTTSKPEKDSVPTQCLKENYHVIDEKDRMWDFEFSYKILEERNEAGICYDDSTFLQNKWIRFESGNDDEKLRLAEDCPSLIADLSSLSNKTFCQALYRGWIQGKHPSALEGRVTRTLCFSRPSTCKCELSSEITVTNCGDFFVYRRRSRDFPHCLARACTVPYRKDEKEKPMSSSIMPQSSPSTTATMSSRMESVISSMSSQDIKATPSIASSSSTRNVSQVMQTVSSIVHSASSSIEMEHNTTIQPYASIQQLVSTSSSALLQPSSSLSYSSSSAIEGIVQRNVPINQEEKINMSLTSSPPSSSGMESIQSSIGQEISTSVVDDVVVESTTGIVSTVSSSFIIERALSSSSTMMMSKDAMMSSSMYVNSSFNVYPSRSLMITDVVASSSVTVTVPETTFTLCKNYKTVTDDGSLSLGKALSFMTCDLKYQSAVRFVSTSGDSLQLKEGCELDDQEKRTCSGFDTNVWLNGIHPTVAGTTVMQVCVKSTAKTNLFYDKDYCRCEQKDVFFVELCTGDREEDLFYVYRLFPLFKSKGNKQDSKECILKYCTELKSGSKKIEILSPEAIPKIEEIFAIKGSFKIENAKLNDVFVTENDIKDEDSASYMFLKKTITDKVSPMFAKITGVSRFVIIGFSIGSLDVEYQVYGSRTLDNTTLNDKLAESFTHQPDIQVSVGSNSLTGKINPQSQQFKAFNMCNTKPCHVNATCTNHVSNNTYSCQCNEDNFGDGFDCTYILRYKVEVKEISNEWSTDSIIIVSVMFGCCFIVILILMFCLCCRHRERYSTSNGVFVRGRNYDNYYNADAPIKDTKHSLPVAQNMYMTTDPSEMKDSSTFTEKVQMSDLDKQNSNFMK